MSKLILILLFLYVIYRLFNSLKNKFLNSFRFQDLHENEPEKQVTPWKDEDVEETSFEEVKDD